MNTCNSYPYNYLFKDIERIRFIHYYTLLDYVRKLGGKSVLIVGIGDFILYDCLSRYGYKVKTCDINPEFHPDYLCDISKPLPIKERFDIIILAVVLEHIEYRLMKPILKELAKVGRNLIISVPYMTLRMFGYGWGKIMLWDNFYLFSDNGKLMTGIPYFFMTLPKYPKSDYNKHRWSLGLKGYGKQRFRELLSTKFDIIGEKIDIPINEIYFCCSGK